MYGIYDMNYIEYMIYCLYIYIVGGVDTIRGFATNTAEYQEIGSITSINDACQYKQNYNPCINEAIYIQHLNQMMIAANITNKGYITDTSRNGNPGCISGLLSSCFACCEWCNVQYCRFGKFPSTDTSSTGISDLIDSFVWSKGIYI